MSIDLALKNGDITIGADGDLEIVADHKKLVQDVIKFVTTPVGSNKFHPAVGSLVNERLIGQNLPPGSTISVLQSSVQEALSTLQKLQRQQSQRQALTPAETIIAINGVEVKQDPIEPRQLNVILKILAGDGSVRTEALTLTL